MKSECSVHCRCFCIAKVNSNSVIVDMAECSDSRDGGECVVRMLDSLELDSRQKRNEENMSCGIVKRSCRGVPCVG